MYHVSQKNIKHSTIKNKRISIATFEFNIPTKKRRWNSYYQMAYTGLLKNILHRKEAFYNLNLTYLKAGKLR